MVTRQALRRMALRSLICCRYNVVLINGGYEELDPDQHFRIKSSSVFIIGITGQQKRDEGMDSKVDLYLRRFFEASKLLQAIAPDKTGG
jgi:hypothetical protein